MTSHKPEGLTRTKEGLTRAALFAEHRKIVE
jgi:hypothetical protein